MRATAAPRSALAAIASVGAHGGILLGLVLLPARPPHLSAEVELQMMEPPPPPVPEAEPPPPAPEPPPPPPEPENHRIVRRAAPPPEPPAAPPPPEEPPPATPPPEEPPVFNMGSDSFANDGAFPLAAGPGNSRFGPVGRVRDPASRPARPAGVPGGTGTAPASFVPAAPGRVARGARVVREVRAPYPEQARDAGIEGVVLLQVEVSRTGTIHSVRVLTDPGYGLGAAAARALRAFRFAPAVDQGGQAIDSRFTYTYRFELDDW